MLLYNYSPVYAGSSKNRIIIIIIIIIIIVFIFKKSYYYCYCHYFQKILSLFMIILHLPFCYFCFSDV